MSYNYELLGVDYTFLFSVQIPCAANCLLQWNADCMYCKIQSASKKHADLRRASQIGGEFYCTLNLQSIAADGLLHIAYRVSHKSRYTFVKGRISVICGPILLSLGLFQSPICPLHF
jgi:hypothetical protein